MPSRASTALLILACANYVLSWRFNTSDHLPPLFTFNASRIGRVSLPHIDKLSPPSICTDMRAACAASARQEYALSFQLLEAKYETCGDYGWELTGHAHGTVNSCVFKVDPCGLPVTIKAPVLSLFECTALLQLTSGSAATECPDCLPKAYYYSGGH